MTIMAKIDSPNYTQIPNLILGDLDKGNVPIPGLMSRIEGAELKVLLAVCRLTFGYHQAERRASLTMMGKLTGLSRQGILDAAARLEGYGFISRQQDGGVTLWKVVVNSVDQSEITQLVNSVDQGVNSVDQGVNSVDSHLRKKPKKKPKKKMNDSISSLSSVEIWQSAQAVLAGAITRATFDQVISPCEARPAVNGTFTLAAPPNLRRQVQRLEKPILQALNQFTKANELEVIVL